MNNLLIFIDWYLPGYNAGGPVRSMANMVDYLHDDFNIKIVTRNTDYQDTAPYKNIKPGEWTTLGKNVQCCYLSKEQVTYKALKNIMREHKNYVVYINGIYSFYFSILPLFLAKKNAKKLIVAPRGMLAASAIEIKKGKKTFFIKIARLFGLYKKALFHATNQNEVEQVQQYISPKANYKIAANLPRRINETMPQGNSRNTGHLKLISIARISPEKNTLFAIQMLNAQYHGNIEFDVYGSVYNQGYFTECKQLATSLPKNIKVSFKGPVDPETTNSLYARADFLFLPTRGENFGHAILESFMAGTPVIISDQTPWKNLEQKGIGWDLPLRDQEAFRRVIQQSIDMDPDEHRQMRRNAFQFAKQYCENPELLKATKDVFNG